MNQKQQDLAAIIRKSHHLKVARYWLSHAFTAVVYAAICWLAGVAAHSHALLLTAASLAGASWGCSTVCDWHLKRARSPKT
jgi:hypothetical protein